MPSKNFVLGIFGGGQLGKLLVIAAKKLKIKNCIYTNSIDSPAIYYADDFIIGSYLDKKKLNIFTKKVSIITFEFENIPFSILKNLEKNITIFPKPEILKTLQNRISEKAFLNKIGVKTTEFKKLKRNKLKSLNKNFFPILAKTINLGYDGKGQTFFKNKSEIIKYKFPNDQYILEKIVNFTKEISVVIVAYKNKFFAYEPIENLHYEQILRQSISPARINRNINEKAKAIAIRIAKRLNYRGVMCVEYFLKRNGDLVVNEIAPRVHNSGHLTLDSYNVSQFESHIRSVCNLQSVQPKKIRNAIMKNALGKNIYQFRERKSNNKEFFYDYGKMHVKEKRKLGHLTKVF